MKKKRKKKKKKNQDCMNQESTCLVGKKIGLKIKLKKKNSII